MLLLSLSCACVERRLFIRTDPSGAVVRVNGREIGTSPATWRFEHYGKVRIEAELPGHEAVQEVVELKAPAREWIFGGLFTDLLWPGTIHDDHEVTVRLPRTKARSDAAMDREIAGLQQRATRARAEAGKR